MFNKECQENACASVARMRGSDLVIREAAPYRRKLSPPNQLYSGNIVKAFQKANAKTDIGILDTLLPNGNERGVPTL
jgi:hypothetical protein